MKVTKISKNIVFSKYFISLLSIFFVSYYIWFRFIRERLPREIPLDLTFLRLIFILCICSLYSYIILRMIMPSQDPGKLSTQFLSLKNKIFLPLLIANDFIMDFASIKKAYDKILVFIIKLIKYLQLSDSRRQFNIYILVLILPRILLLIIFVMDVFLFQTLLKKLQEKPFTYYDTTGVTKEEAFRMCIEYDKNITSQGKHPKIVDIQNEIEKTKSPKLKKENLDNENNISTDK